MDDSKIYKVLVYQYFGEKYADSIVVLVACNLRLRQYYITCAIAIAVESGYLISEFEELF